MHGSLRRLQTVLNTVFRTSRTQDRHQTVEGHEILGETIGDREMMTSVPNDISTSGSTSGSLISECSTPRSSFHSTRCLVHEQLASFHLHTLASFQHLRLLRRPLVVDSCPSRGCGSLSDSVEFSTSRLTNALQLVVTATHGGGRRSSGVEQCFGTEAEFGVVLTPLLRRGSSARDSSSGSSLSVTPP